ncbi:MAG: ascorbate-dependent monooxygenase, partial [Isosphaeraceae bacterium]
ADLVAVAEDRRMPPWHASTEVGGPFRDVRALSDGEIALLRGWVEAGCPEGDPADSPPPATYPDDWPLGPPDLVLKPEEAFRLDASGSDDYRVFVLPTGLTEGKWVAAVDFRPGNPKVVHHILGAFDRTGAGRKLDQADEGPGYRPNQGFGINPVTTVLAARIGDFGGMSGWAPGKSPRPLPPGIGRYLPAGSDILLQIHYHRSGKVETDQTAIGLYFAKGTIDKQVVGGAVFPPRGKFLRPDMEIPAGDASYEVAGRMAVNEDSHLIGIIPHMHLLGKDFMLKAALPDGSERTLIRVDRWDFNWQDVYEFADPVALPKGTTVMMVAHFDNSGSNPANPSKPPKAVRWGEQTTDEMCIGFLQLTRDNEKLGGKPPERPAGASLFGGDR